ncbi:MAG: AAA family ATPase [Planctomycetaceae bacterium]
MPTHREHEPDLWAERADGLSSIEIPESPQPPAEFGREKEPPCPPECRLGPNIRVWQKGEPLRAKPDKAREPVEYVIRQPVARTTRRSVSWLWPGRIPLGKLTLLVGDVGVGKSLLMLDIAARLSRGLAWPDGEAVNPPSPDPPPLPWGARRREGDAVERGHSAPAPPGATPPARRDAPCEASPLAADPPRPPAAPGPDAPRLRRGYTLILAAEDAIDDTIRPRLERLGAELRLIEALPGISGYDQAPWRRETWERPLVLPDDIGAIEAVVRERYAEPLVQLPLVVDGVTYSEHRMICDPDEGPIPPVRLLILDPLVSFFPRAVGSDNAQIRRMLQPLVDLAARYRLAIVGIHHLNKKIGQPALYRALGSQALPAVARMVWGVTPDPDDPARRMFHPLKNNLGPLPAPLAFRIDEGRLVWEAQPVASGGNTNIKDDLRMFQRWRCDEAVEWLREVLVGGEQQAREVLAKGAQVGISGGTLAKARFKLGVRLSQRKHDDGQVRFFWSLPTVSRGA